MSVTEFSGFGTQSLPFLKALAFHQDRAWFQENKAIYEREIRRPMGDLVETLSARFEKAGIPLRGDRKTSLYRVNRDVRFSKNKDPYVTHASAMLTRSGTKKENGFVYMHYSNERSFIATGFYGLEGDALRAFRELLLRETERFSAIHDDLARHGYVLETEGILKRNPRGFETVEDEPLRHWIRMKNHPFAQQLTPEIFQSPALADRMFEMGRRAMPLLEFGWRAIDSVRGEG